MQRFTTRTGDELAYVHTPGAAPLCVFLGGFMSDMTGSKAQALQAWAQEQGQAFLRFDYHGHGASSGAFREGTIGRWKDNAHELITHIAQEHGHEAVVLVGSSMGGWIMLHLALAMPQQVKALVGVAAAPDFTRYLIWDKLTPAQHETMRTQGEIVVPSCYGNDHYPITRALIEDGEVQCLLEGGTLAQISCPVRLLHGTADDDVPYETSLQIMQQVGSADLQIILVKDGDHRLSEPPQLALLSQHVGEMVQRVKEHR